MWLLVWILVLYAMAACLHELGHAIAGELFGSPVKGLKLTWAGVCVIRDAGSPFPNLLISAAGPLMSGAIGVATWSRWDLFATANLCLFMANIIPIRGSDGDRIWMCAGQLGWIHDQTLPRRGLGRQHDWLKSKGFSS